MPIYRDLSFPAGEGILTDANGTVYKGSFYKNREHGDGLEVLRYDRM